MAILLSTFAATILFGGHGFGPLGLLLALGWDEWTIPVILGWSGIGVVIAGKLTTGVLGARLLRLGTLTCTVAWTTFVWRSEILPFTLLTSLPFLASAVVAWQRTWSTTSAG